MKLSQKSLDSLPSAVSRPNYDRAELSPGILHIGVGNFHRAHQAVFLDRLFNLGQDHDWGIMGAGIMPYDSKMREQLSQQDWLNTVIELDPNGYTARVCGAMVNFADVSIPGLISALSQPEIRIVSMTITEGGYYIDAKTGGFDHNHADVIRDGQHPDTPQTVFGALVTALKYRKLNGIRPFTVMSCDNVPENGEIAKAATIGFAKAVAPDLVDWIDQTIAFPNGMVDCITPATGTRERAMVFEKFAIEDPAVVVCEPYRQWVLEDNFPYGRPALEKVGVKFVDDVAPYEQMKLRIVNGGHAAIAYPASLLGLQYAHDAMYDTSIQGFLDKLQTEEIIPTLPPVPGVDFDQYFRQTKWRFSNPEIGDTIARLCLDGSNRQPKFILPTIHDRLAQQAPVSGLVLEVALWCRYCAGIDEQGATVKIHDENAGRLQLNAMQAKEDPRSFLAMSDIFGSLSTNSLFSEEFSKALGSLWRNGVRKTLENYINEGKYF